MSTIFLLHGTYGHPEENWFPWLQRQLEQRGHEVIAPLFPTPEDQDLLHWHRVMQPLLRKISDDTVIVGHSLGALFALRVLEKHKGSIAAAFLVAGFLRPLGNPEFDVLNETFTQGSWHWDAVRAHCRSFTVFRSDNDPFVPAECTEELARLLRTPCTIVQGAGHFNEKAGYSTFPALLAAMEQKE